MDKRRVGQWLLFGSCCLIAGASEPWPRSGPASPPSHRQVSEARDWKALPARPPVPASTVLQVAAAPMHFERTEAEEAGDVRFMARGAGYAVLLAPTETAVVL